MYSATCTARFWTPPACSRWKNRCPLLWQPSANRSRLSWPGCSALPGPEYSESPIPMHEITFRWILTKTNRREEISISFLLAWTMLIDSNASDSEISLLREVHRDPDITVDQLIEAVRQRSPYDLATALRILPRHATFQSIGGALPRLTPSDRLAVEMILLDTRRRAIYDRTRAVVEEVGRVRAILGERVADLNWGPHYADFQFTSPKESESRTPNSYLKPLATSTPTESSPMNSEI